MSADSDLLAFVLRHGEYVSRVLADAGTERAVRAASDLAWLVKVNRPDWSHDVHSADCMDDGAESRRVGMTVATVEANHRLHMGHVGRIDAALRGVR